MRRDLSTQRSRSSWDLFREMDQLFNQLNGVSAETGWPTEEAPVTFKPATDIRENERGYLMAFDLPGLSEKDVKIEVRDGTLIISGERKREATSGKDGWTRTERTYGRFFRSFSLPKEVNAGKIEAQVENGELHLFLPKTEAAKPLEVTVKAKAKEEPHVMGLMERFFGGKDPDQKDHAVDVDVKH